MLNLFTNISNLKRTNIFNFVLLSYALWGIIFIVNNDLWLNNDQVFYWRTHLGYTKPFTIFLYTILIRFVLFKDIPLELNKNINFSKNVEIFFLFFLFSPLLILIFLKEDGFFLYNNISIFYVLNTFSILGYIDLFSVENLSNFDNPTVLLFKFKKIVGTYFFIDGISLWLSWLTLFIYYVISCNKNKQLTYLKKYKNLGHSLLINNLLEFIIFLMLICFLTKNLYIFFIAFESVLIPLIIYISLHGSRFDKITAIKYLFVYTIIGSIFLWLAIAYLIENVGTSSYENLRWILETTVSSDIRKFICAFLLIGFAFKIPAVPLHHWLISAHVEAPTNGSIILAALLLKVGGYGIFRFVYNILPLEVFFFADELICWCIFSYTYASIQAIRQSDLKRYIAYTSIAHMNFALIGLFTNSDFGVLGFLHTMVSHGIISTALFYIVGYIYSNLEFRDTIRLSGLCTKMPVISLYFFIFSLANIGIPLFSGFPGEFYIISSLVYYNTFYAVLLIIPFMVTGFYNFFQTNKIIFNSNGTESEVKLKFSDSNKYSEHVLFILLVWCIILGLSPELVFFI